MDTVLKNSIGPLATLYLLQPFYDGTNVLTYQTKFCGQCWLHRNPRATGWLIVIITLFNVSAYFFAPMCLNGKPRGPEHLKRIYSEPASDKRVKLMSKNITYF
jgi:hypothetical protein